MRIQLTVILKRLVIYLIRVKSLTIITLIPAPQDTHVLDEQEVNEALKSWNSHYHGEGEAFQT